MQVGEGTAVMRVTAKRPPQWKETSNSADCAHHLALVPRADELLEWDVFDVVLSPGDLILMVSWRDKESTEKFEGEFTISGRSKTTPRPDRGRLRDVRPA
jgi:hypothetical protein